MSFVVEIPSVFTKPTQIPVRLGNTILTGNETIQGSLSVNGSLTLNSGDSVDNTNVVYYDSLDISNNLNVGGNVSVQGHSNLSDVSATTLTVATSAIINKTLIHNPFPNAMCIAHSNFTTQQDFALLQYSGGSTVLNAPLGKFISFANNGTAVASIGATELSLTGDLTMGGYINRKNSLIRYYRNSLGTFTADATFFILTYPTAQFTNTNLITTASNNSIYTVVKAGRYKLSTLVNVGNGTYADRENWRIRLFVNNAWYNNTQAFCYTRHKDYARYGSMFLSDIVDLVVGNTFYWYIDCNRASNTDFTSVIGGSDLLEGNFSEIEYLGT